MIPATPRIGLNVRPEPDEERELLERIAAGDRLAMQKFYFAFHRRLNRFLSRTLRRPDQVEEIINDAMLIVWRQAREFRGESRVSTWLMGIAYRLALKRLKREQGRRWLPLREESERSVTEAAHDAGAAQREQREWITAALATLPAAQRLAIELAYFMGYSCEEIAEITECPVNTVKTRLFHAREQLRSRLPQVSGAPIVEERRNPA